MVPVRFRAGVHKKHRFTAMLFMYRISIPRGRTPSSTPGSDFVLRAPPRVSDAFYVQDFNTDEAYPLEHLWVGLRPPGGTIAGVPQPRRPATLDALRCRFPLQVCHRRSRPATVYAAEQ